MLRSDEPREIKVYFKSVRVSEGAATMNDTRDRERGIEGESGRERERNVGRDG